MQRKHRLRNSVDGFVPRNGTSQAGFGASRQERGSIFPGVGMTMNSYNGQAAAVETPAPLPKAKKHRKRFSWKRAFAIFAIIILLLGGWLGYKFGYNALKVFHGNLFSILNTTKLKGEDSGRVNILLAGNSSDDPGHQGAQLTDSIMILSLDIRDNKAYMLSVPRDLWVDIPGHGHAKINEAYVDGENDHFNQSGYFPGGMGLLQETIEQDFDVNLQYYGLVDYNAFRDMVNAVGGIDVNIQSTDPRGLYDPSIDWSTHGPLVKLANGVHHLDGEQALDLARARGDAYGSYGFPQSDFNRTANQRLMLMALRSKITSSGVVANPVALTKLSDAVGSNVKTNMSLSEARRAYDLTKNMPSNSIQSVGLNNVNGKNLLASYTTPYGQSALIPAAGIDDFSAIQSYIKQLNSNTNNQVTQEGAQVVVLNASDSSGVATTNSKTLSAKGITVAESGDAPTRQTTEIVDLSAGKMPATKALLQSLYGTNVTTVDPFRGAYNADFIILIGNDHASSTSASGTGTSQ